MKKFFDKVDKEFDEEGTKQSSEYSVFNRAWHYIKDINIDTESHLYAAIKQDTKYLLDSLKLAIEYFENTEEYERCAHLYKIEQTVKTF